MSYQKLQGGRLLSVIPSDTINIVSPSNAKLSGTTTAATSGKLTDSSASFSPLTVQIGDIVRNETDGAVATVTAVDSATVLSLSANIIGNSKSYRIFSKDGDKGAVFYVGSGGDITVESVGGDVVQLAGVATGSFVPVKVNKIYSTGLTADSIVAIW